MARFYDHFGFGLIEHTHKQKQNIFHQDLLHGNVKKIIWHWFFLYYFKTDKYIGPRFKQHAHIHRHPAKTRVSYYGRCFFCNKQYEWGKKTKTEPIIINRNQQWIENRIFDLLRKT